MDLKSRIIYLHGNIDQEMGTKALQQLRHLDNSRGSIVLDINSDGGDVTTGMMLVDAIGCCTNSVVGLVTGMAESIAFVILQACERRVAYRWATLMYHHGTRTAGEERNYYEHANSSQYDVVQSDKIDFYVYKQNRNDIGEFSDFQVRALKSFFISADEAVSEGWLDGTV